MQVYLTGPVMNLKHLAKATAARLGALWSLIQRFLYPSQVAPFAWSTSSHRLAHSELFILIPPKTGVFQHPCCPQFIPIHEEGRPGHYTPHCAKLLITGK